MEGKISHSGLLARSPEGHAARGMQIKGNEDLWVDIQANTFRNWVNEHLPQDLRVADLSKDLCTGVRLCLLVEALRKKPLKPSWNKRPANQHHYLENVTCALSAIEQDGIKLVNIGNTDIVNGNLKLILGLIWSLIVHYQIGRSKFPPRKLMLSWLQAVLPECKVSNLTTDWNSGVLLSALVDYCRPGLFPHWRQLDRSNEIENCRRAMNIAQKDLGIPAVLEPEYLASPWLDELSGMTYLSYFMKPGSPGFYATLRWVNSRLERSINNFTTDWNDGRVISEVIRSLGGSAAAPEKLRSDYAYWEQNQIQAIEAGRRLGVQPVLSAKDMADRNVEHLGVMAYAAHFQWVPERPPLHDLINVTLNSTSGRVGEPVSAPRREDILVTAYSPSGRPLDCPLTVIDGTNSATFKPDEPGEWRIEITYQGKQIQGGPFTCSVFDPNGVQVSGIEGALPLIPHAIEVDCRGVGVPGEVVADIVHDKKSVHCHVEKIDNFHYRIHFTPKDAGKHRVYVYFNGYDVKGSPFMMRVGTQKRSKISSSPTSPYRASPTNRFNSPSPNLSTPTKNSSYTSYRQNASPLLDETHKFAQDYHMKSVSEKRMPSSSPIYQDRTHSPSYNQRTHSPVYRTASPNFHPPSPNYRPNSPPVQGRDSPDFITSRKLNEKRYDFTNKMSSMRLEDSRSPSYLERSSPDVGFTSTSRYDKRVSENRVFTNSSNGVDTTPIIKVSSLNDQSSARRDSWDAIAKTKNILSDRSLESLANLTESQLDTDIRRRKAEEHSKFVLKEQSYQTNYNENYSSSKKYSDSFGRNSPVYSRVRKDGGASSVKVQPVPDGVLGQPVEFEIDGSGAGSGDLEILVEGGRVTSSVKSLGGQRFRAAFTPHQALPHRVDIRFNGETVPGSPWHVNIMSNNSALSVLGEATRLVPANSPAVFEIITPSSTPPSDLRVHVVAPSKRVVSARVIPGNRLGVHSVEFVPTEIGTHLIDVSVDGEKLPSGPLMAKVYDAGLIQVADVGGGVVGQPVQFREISFIYQKISFYHLPYRPTTLPTIPHYLMKLTKTVPIGPGGQAVPTQVQPLGNGQFRAEFVPRVVGEHRVNVSVSGVPTVGSPYAAKVYDVQAIKIKEAASGIVGKPVTFLVETSQAGPGNLEVTVNGGLVPTSAQAQGPHTYAISFTPREATVHSVDLRFNGQDVPGSPFKCAVSPAARILSLDTLDKVSVGKPCTFVVESPNPPTVEILGPARRALVTKVRPQENTVGKFEVTFTPIDVGDHSVEVRLQSGHIDGSPFLIKAYDANRVTVTDITDGIVGKPVSFSINASQAGAGNLEIIVAVGGRNVPNFVQSEGNARFKVNFKPTEAATHTLSVRFNGQPVPGSPFNCKVSPGNTQPRVPVSGSGIELAAVGHPAEIKIEGVTGGEPQVLATAPNGKTIPTKLIVNGDTYIARFIPESVGRHSIAILINDQHVIGSPFSCNVYDVNKVIVTGLPERKGDLNTSINELSLKDAPKPAEVGKPVTFSVDAAQAGEGTLELVVSTQHTTIKAEVVACARGLYDVTFVPLTAEDHYVNITFNDMTVVGSPFHCSVIESTQYFQIGATAYIDLPSDNHKIEISDPNNHHVKYVVNNYKGEFSLTQTGTYRVNILRDNEVVATRTFHVFDTTKIDIINAPEAICHRPSAIGINMNRVGPGKLTAAVKVGNRDVSHSVRQSPTNANMWEVIFHPVQAAPHRITLFYNGVPKFGVLEIPVKGPGSEPWAGGLGLYQAKVGKVNSFQIETQGRSAREFDVVVSGPTGSAVPVRCYQTKTGKLQAEFTSREIGAHKVEVLHQGKHLVGSPFVCQAFDPDNVKITDVPTSQGNVGDKVYFNISTKSSGSAELDVQVTNPIHQTLAVQKVQSDENTTQVMFLPALAGLYQVAITYGGIPVKGSPLALGVGPVGPTPPPRAVGKGLEFGRVGERSSFTVSSVVQPRVSVEAVEGNIDVQVQSHKPGEYQVSYVPKWVGTYDVIISIGPNDLPGSPFRPSVVDPAAVRLIGGWNQYLDDTGRIKLPAKLAFDTSNAGPGNLECKISGRKVNQEKSNTRIRFELSGEGLSPGEHEFDIRFANYPLPEAPSSIICLGDQVVLTGRGLAHAQCGDAATFTIDGSKASIGNPEVTLHAADNNIPVPVMISLAGDKIWKAAYTVSIPGNYLLSVLWAGRPVKGCPLVVEAKGGADASKVLCSGEGLRQGVVGREIRSWIDTRRAGPGELTAHCAGPRKVAYCELYDHGDATFTLNVKPQEPGRHALTIKYAGQHVPGSPFTLRVAGAPDASKVRVYGPGIEHGVLATFQSRFICDTRGAGAGQLTVRVRGPKGAFRVEMQRESQKDRTILCKIT
uniref:Filamin-A-like n=1 Tax=Diabrotica virgifera virgifera TaxID=50390 RepID=A0A6P7EZ55_DIAVI